MRNQYVWIKKHLSCKIQQSQKRVTMSMISSIKTLFQRDSAAISAAKELPTAYRDMLGLDFMVCADKENFDWSGLGEPVALAEVKSANSESGEFDFFFVIQKLDDRESFDRFRCKMSVKQAEDSFLFSVKNERTEIASPVTPENLRPVLKMALRNREQVGLHD